MTHTPGPWHYEVENHSRATAFHSIRDKDGKVIVSSWAAPSDSDAALIAAAPELLEAARDAANQLRTIAALLNHIPPKYAAQITGAIRYGDIDAVIAKAEPKP